MKRIIAFICVLVILFTAGCRKTTINPDISEPAKIEITFSDHSYGPRTIIEPDGSVSWQTGDQIQVYHSKDGYLGAITFNDSFFTGEIVPWTDEGQLRFIYMGNNRPPTVKSDNTTVIDFTQQIDSDLITIAENYHIAIYKVTVSNEIVHTFYGTMKNITALACFDLSGFSDASNIKMYSPNNLYNKLTISPYGDINCGFAGASSSGHIMIEKSVGLKYLALLPQDENTPAEVKFIFTTQNHEGEDIVQRTIYPGGYLNNKQPIVIQSYSVEDEFDDLTLPGKPQHVFTVYDKDGSTKKVIFAHGNVVYDRGRFRIHREQYNTLLTNDVSVGGTFDNFCWATSGWSNGNTYYQPYATEHLNTSTNGYGYGPYNGKSYAQSIHPDKQGSNPYRFSDWGRYRFDMDTYGQTNDGRYWRLMGDGEWATLFSRKDSQNRYLWGYANVCNVNGCVLLPDDWSEDVEFTYGSTNFTNNVLSQNEWDGMENEGAVFLPFNGEEGRYWGAKHSNSDKAGCFTMNTKQHSISPTPRYMRCYVRLVYQVQGSVWKPQSDNYIELDINKEQENEYPGNL